MAENSIDDRALDRMSVAPEEDTGARHQGDAGRDESIARRLAKNPESKEARLDNDLDQSMDASDPLSATQPVHNQGPAPSSGYDPDAEAKLRAGS